MINEQLVRAIVADNRDRVLVEAHRLGRAELARYRRPSFVLQLMRRLSHARRAAPVTAASIVSAAAPKITAPTT